MEKNPTLIKKSFFVHEVLVIEKLFLFFFSDVIWRADIFECFYQVEFNTTEIRGHLSSRGSKPETFLASSQLQK